MISFLNSERYHCTYFFVENWSDSTFANHKKHASAKKTIIDKHIYEHQSKKFGKEVTCHYVGNRTHATTKCKQKSENQNQTLSFYGACIHYQNCKVENKIKITCNPCCRKLIHAMNKCPEVITQALFLLTIFLAAGIWNKYNIDKIGVASIEKLIRVAQPVDTNHDYTFIFPITQK